MHEYKLADHLGNTRLMFDASGKVLQETDYYAFGLQHERPTNTASDNRFLFGDKQLENNGTIYDFEARPYDPALGRFMSIDPLADSYASTNAFVYCHNSPISRIDPTGMGDLYYYPSQSDIRNNMGEYYDSEGNIQKKDYAPGLQFGSAPTTGGLTSMVSQGMRGSQSNFFRENPIRVTQTDYYVAASMEEAKAQKGRYQSTVYNFEYASPLGNMEDEEDGDNKMGSSSKASSSNRIIGDGYGNNIGERLSNLPRAIWNGDVFRKNPNVTELGMDDNPISILIPLTSLPKVIAGFKVVGDASKTTLTTSSLASEIGFRGFIGARVWTPLGSATSWAPLIGRWAAATLPPVLTYLQISKLLESYEKK